MDIVFTLTRFQSGATGVNGRLELNGQRLCFTIERPWLENQRRVSCIPEGRYELRPRRSQKFSSHLILLNVPNRDLILIHPANNAMKELNGCIAPVTNITGIGLGTASRIAFNKIMKAANDAFAAKRKVFINIVSGQ